MFSLNRNDKVKGENVEGKLQEVILRVTKREVQFEQFISLNVPTSQHVLRLISTFFLQKFVAYPSQRLFTNVNFVIKNLVVFIPCEYIDRKCAIHKVYRRAKMWI